MSPAAAAAIVQIGTVLFAAPLVLGAFVVLQHASWQVARLYFGLLSVLLTTALLAGMLGVIVLQR